MKFADLEISMRTDLSKVIGEINAANKKLDEVSLNTKKAADAAERSAGVIERAGEKMKVAFGVATAAAAAFAGFIATKLAVGALDQAAEKIDHLGKVSKQLQIPIRDLSILRFAAGESGVEFETLATMSAKAAKNLAEFTAGGKSTMKIADVTVELKNARGQLKSITELLPDIARGLESADSAGERISLATKIFGKEGGAQFVKFLADGGNFAKNMADQAERAGKLGVIFTDDQVTKLTAYRDAVGRVEEAWLGLKVAIMTEIAPVISDIANNLALQIGSLPGVIRAAMRMVSLSIHGDKQAFLDFNNLTGTLYDALAVVVKRVASLAVTTFVEGLKVGVAAVWPTIADGMQDALAAALKNSPFEIPMSAGGKLDHLRDLKAQGEQNLPGMRSELKSLIDNSSGNWTAGTGAGGPWVAIVNLEKRIKEIENLDKSIALAEAEVQAIKQSRLSNFGRTMEAAGKEINTEFENAKKEIGAATEKWNKTRDEIIGRYAPPAESTASQGVGFGFGDWLLSLGDQLEFGTIKLEAVQPRLAGIMDKLQAKSREILEFGKTLNVRSMKASGDSDGADRLQLLHSFDKEIAELSSKLGTSLIPQLQAVHAAELAAFDAKKVEEMRKQTDGWAESLKKTYMPVDRLQEDIERLNIVFDAGKLSLDEYHAILEKILEKIKQLQKEGDTVWTKMGKAVENFSGNASRFITDLVFDAKGSFSDLFESFGRMLVDTMVKAQIMDPLFKALGAGISSYFGGMFAGGTTGQAHGGVWDAGEHLTRFAAGGVVSRRTRFAMANGGMGEMGEAGPEGIFPLTRIGGDLGVRATGMGTVINFIDQRSGGERETSESNGPDGRKLITVLIRDTVKGEIASGGMDAVMSNTFGLKRRGIPR